jgi:PiT family inorganic phosphate transporter
METSVKEIKEVPSGIEAVMTDFVKFATAFTFAIVTMVIVYFYNEGVDQRMFLAVAALIAAYMAMNIGANDVTNNVGPAVGAGAITLGGALLIAVIFEAAGSLLAGGDVTQTISKNIINTGKIAENLAASGAAHHLTDAEILLYSRNTVLWLMAGALLGGAIWLNVATASGAPVSTTHSIIGGVVGSGIAAAGWSVVDWAEIGRIVMSWFISPVLGGLCAALFLIIIKKTILFKEDMVSASKKVVPILVAIMTFSFVTYLALKGIRNIVKLSLLQSAMIGGGAGIVTWLALIPTLKSAGERMQNTREAVNKLFQIPIIFSAALLCFAHGANDVANAVGPLTAIRAVLEEMGDPASTAIIPPKAPIVVWVMWLGALGLVVGLGTYGPKLIKTVGSEITEMDNVRAWSIAMSSAIVVIVASWMGLPVSSTHIALGAVFGVGFLRIYLASRFDDRVEQVKEQHIRKTKQKLAHLEEELGQLETDEERATVQTLIERKQKELSDIAAGNVDFGGEIEQIEKDKLLKMSLVYKIFAAWFITVPAAAIISALSYYLIRGFMLEV